MSLLSRTRWLKCLFGRDSTTKAAKNKFLTKRPSRRFGNVEELEGRIVPVAPPLQFSYLPLSAADLYNTFHTLSTGAGSTIHVVVTITVMQDNTVIYYDHGQDGYEANLANPTQATTQVWGDGNTSNGTAPGFATDILKAGDVITITNDVPVPANPGTTYYNGGDLIGASANVNITEAAWPTNIGTVLATAVAVPDTRLYGNSFVAPVGTDVASGQKLFSYSAFYVTAAQDNTQVTINLKNGGTITQTLNQGQTYVSPATVQAGDTVSSSAPVTVTLATGDLGDTYESRWFTLYDNSQLSNDYYSPLSTQTAAHPVNLFVFNPNSTAITVNYQTQTTSGSFTVAAGATYQYAVPDASATRLYTSNGMNFVAVAADDVTPAGQNGDSAQYDWGFTLQPTNTLTTSAIVALGVGDSGSPPTTADSPIWVTATKATTVYVNYSGNTSLGPNIDPDGNHYDVSYTLSALQSQLVSNPSFDSSGMRLYSLDGTPISVAWGENPAVAPIGNPGFDAGTVVPSIPVPDFNKTVSFAPGGDIYGDGRYHSGDTIRYALTVSDTGIDPITNAIVFDGLPAGLTYVANSTQIKNGTTTTQIPDDSSGTAFPLDDGGYTVVNVDPHQVTTITFDATINSGLPAGTTSLTNTATLDSIGETITATATATLASGIGHRVWLDSNGNGIQDAGENGVAGFTVYALSAGATIATTTTDASGNYLFSGLSAGAYTIQFSAPAGDVFSPQTQGSDPTVDSNPNGAGLTGPVTLSDGQVDNTIDAGIYPAASIGGNAWNDTNGDGVQQGTETNFPGVTVYLESSGSTVGATTTDASGNYSFTGLTVGSFTVQFVAPATYEFSTPASDNFTLIPGQKATANAGLDQNAEVGGNVWLDSNDNAVNDAGETNVAGVTVYLLNNSSATVGTATTDANGNYSFANLAPGSYSIQFVAPAGDFFSTSSSDAVTLISGQTNNNVNAGLFQPAAVNGEVWSDTNANGVIDAGENGLAGITVDLVSGTTTLTSTTTDANGNYSFAGLNPGSYSVQFVAPVGDLFSTPSSDAFTLTSGETDSFNAGLYQNGAITGNAWLDTNANGVRNTGEPNLPGVTVYLLNSSNATIGTTTTDANGNYAFPNISPGAYEVTFSAPSGDQFSTPSSDRLTITSGQVGIANAGLFAPNSLAGKVYLDADANGTLDAGESGVAGVTIVLSGTDTSGNTITPQTVTSDGGGNFQFSINPSGNFTLTETPPAGYLDGKDTPGSAGGTAGTDQISGITLSGGTNGAGYNFAEVQANMLSGTVFNDLNNNGQQNAGEPGIAGVTMTLTGTNDLGQSVSLTMTTDASGAYSYGNLRPGSYQLTQTLPGNWLAGKNTPGQAGVTNSGETMQTFQLTSGQTVAGNLFADLQGAQVIGIVYNDLNDNGAQDPGEPGLAGVTMTLTGTEDTGASVSLTLTTASDGSFAFTNLRPGQYTLQETQPAQFQPGTNAVGTQGGTQTSPGTFANFTLAPGQTGSGNSFGQWQPGSLEGKVYFDANGNGQQDPGEPNLPGVTLTLTGVSNGTSITQTTTSGVDGTFIFNNLTPGIYAVTETPPAGLFMGNNQLGTGGGTLNGNTMSNIEVGANDQFINYTFAVSPFNPLDPPFTKRYFLGMNQSIIGVAWPALADPVAAPAASGDPATFSFQSAFLPSQNGNAAPPSAQSAVSPSSNSSGVGVSAVTITAPASPVSKAITSPADPPPTTPFSNFDLLRILASDASLTSPISGFASSNGTSAAFRAAALLATFNA
ncbi:MAG TPA: SdrD B-like domain-containing protein [Gemmataceae bacterium]|nr:SdrD B-like domain-containing protein [Gemmataceae bacterium]